MASRFFLTLIKKIPLTHNVTSFIFEKPKDFIFLAGQYVRIFDPVDGESIFRDFTISSSPLDKDSLTLTIKHGITEYKKRLFGMPLGTKFYVEAPMGRFYLHDNETSPLVFIAGGVGIAPFYSIIADLIEKKTKLSLTLFGSFSTVEDMLFEDELKKLGNVHKNLQLVYTITQLEKSKKKWEGETSHISEQMLKKYVKNLSSPKFLISGSPSLVRDMEDLLIAIGVGLEQIRTEIFLGF